MKRRCFFTVLFVLLLASRAASAGQGEPVRYLAFQIFTGQFNTTTMLLDPPPSRDALARAVDDIRGRVYVPPVPGRRAGFMLGPLSFDQTDDEVTRLIAESFDIALDTGMATGFHIDDSMFWGRIKTLGLPGNLEWTDWAGTPGTGRRLDWGPTPMKIMPQLCVNSHGVTEAVKKRAALIGDAVKKGLKKLHDADRDDLFMGVIAGWETQIGKDFSADKPTGYCALTNKGFSATHPPADFDQARSDAVRDFVALWEKSLVASGVPREKIYAHIAFMSEGLFKFARSVAPAQMPASYLYVTNATPVDVAFTDAGNPGFTTYPQPGRDDEIDAALEKHGNPPWASSEGLPIDPAIAAQGGPGGDMAAYLGSQFNHGAALVNIFGWGVGAEDNGFRKVAEADASVVAYRRFLKGETLKEERQHAPVAPSPELPKKMRLIQDRLPAYAAKNGGAQVSPLMDRIDDDMKGQKFDDAEKTADDVLKILK